MCSDELSSLNDCIRVCQTPRLISLSTLLDEPRARPLVADLVCAVARTLWPVSRRRRSLPLVALP
jgi:hypothetical protein